MNTLSRPSSVLILSVALTWPVILSSAGCSSLKADVPFKYTASLRSGEPIAGKAVFRLIEDMRSKEDRETTREITDCADKLTAKLVDDFRTTRLFTDVDYSASQPECDYVITGKLEEFSWKGRLEAGMFIPFGPYLGLPLQTFTAKAKVTLEVLDGKSSTMLARYSASGFNRTTYNMYEMKGVEMGVELQYALRDAIKQIKDQMTKDARLRQKLPASTQGAKARVPT